MQSIVAYTGWFRKRGKTLIFLNGTYQHLRSVLNVECCLGENIGVVFVHMCSICVMWTSLFVVCDWWKCWDFFFEILFTLMKNVESKIDDKKIKFYLGLLIISCCVSVLTFDISVENSFWYFVEFVICICMFRLHFNVFLCGRFLSVITGHFTSGAVKWMVTQRNPILSKFPL